MTQRIENKATSGLLNVLLEGLKEWPAEWGEWAVASRIEGGFGVWFCPREPRNHERQGWTDVGTVEAFLAELPYDHLSQVVTRKYWLANRSGGLAELARGSIEFDEAVHGAMKAIADTAIKLEAQATQCEYYEAPVEHPQNPRQGGVPYIPNCEDIIQALGLTFDEGCEFKSLWRRGRARQGFVKAESTPLRDAQKAYHYAGRVLALEQRKAAK